MRGQGAERNEESALIKQSRAAALTPRDISGGEIRRVSCARAVLRTLETAGWPFSTMQSSFNVADDDVCVTTTPCYCC